MESMIRDVDDMRETENSIYSNFDHQLEVAVVEELMADPNKYAQHAAREFCAYLFFRDGKWHSEVWRYGSLVERITGESPMEVIREANEIYGDE